jgi:hypothetical protein
MSNQADERRPHRRRSSAYGAGSTPRSAAKPTNTSPDGSGRVVSGEERSEFAWVLDPKRTDNGFHRLDATIMKDHGGNDCTGSAEDDTNRRHTVYVKFHPDGDQHIVCSRPELEQCFGPLRRQAGAAR